MRDDVLLAALLSVWKVAVSSPAPRRRASRHLGHAEAGIGDRPWVVQLVEIGRDQREQFSGSGLRAYRLRGPGCRRHAQFRCRPAGEQGQWARRGTGGTIRGPFSRALLGERDRCRLGSSERLARRGVNGFRRDPGGQKTAGVPARLVTRGPFAEALPERTGVPLRTYEASKAAVLRSGSRGTGRQLVHWVNSA